MMVSSTTKLYEITVVNNDGACIVTMQMTQDELGVDYDILAESLRVAFVDMVPNAIKSFINKSEVYANLIYPPNL